jgi:hypothetical protein
MLENWSARDVQRDPEGFWRAQQQERERLCIFAPHSS